MVVIELRGGLGNQLFEYALGRHVALINRVPLRLDTITGFACDTFHRRQYALGPFRTVQRFATDRERRTVLMPRRSYRLGIALQRLRAIVPCGLAELVPAHGSTICEEKKLFVFDPDVLQPSINNVVLRGYWQNERYFRDIARLLRHEITLRQPLEGLAAAVLQEVKAVDAVALHVRRRFAYAGGRIDPGTARHHGVLPLEYYMEAVRRIAVVCPRPRFFVFADDPEWAAEHVRLPYPVTFVTGNRDYEDLVLMSLCRHQIIANSSFGWWGAWLNPNADKLVVAPKAYVADTTCDTGDLYPKSWMVI